VKSLTFLTKVILFFSIDNLQAYYLEALLTQVKFLEEKLL